MNVKFTPKVVAGGDSAEELLTEFTKTSFNRAGLSHFGPAQEHFTSYTQMALDLEGKIASVIAFDIQYESATGRSYRECVVIDMSEHKGAYQLERPHIYSIAQSLEKLQRDVGT